MRIKLTALLVLAVAAQAHAQIGRQPFQLSQPSSWISLGVGYQQGFDVEGTTTGTWEFADGTQFVASIEKTVSNGISFGVASTTALLPVRVGSLDYDANVSQAFATVHVANGGPLHTALDFRAGATYYGQFQLKNCPTCGALAPRPGNDTDFSFGLGYGLGYSFSPRLSVDVVQDLTTSIHQRDPAISSGSASSRTSSTRLIGRVGF